MKVKTIVKGTKNWDMEYFEDKIISDEGREVGFFPDELKNYPLTTFIGDFLITALEDHWDAVQSIYVDFDKSHIKLTVCEKAWESMDVYLSVIQRLLKVFEYPYTIETVM